MQISSLRFSKIGSVIRHKDGSFDIGPLPRIGGPFKTASEYFKAWAAKAKFPYSIDHIKRVCGEHGDDIAASIADFPSKVVDLSDKISAPDLGQYILSHRDYGHNNIVVNDDYDILGVIDWEDACVVPPGILEFPLTLQMVPRSMDLPSNYDDRGLPIDAAGVEKALDREAYVNYVRREEACAGLSSTLSDALANERIQDVATAMRLYTDGKMGYYTKVLEPYLT